MHAFPPVVFFLNDLVLFHTLNGEKVVGKIIEVCGYDRELGLRYAVALADPSWGDYKDIVYTYVFGVDGPKLSIFTHKDLERELAK